MGWFFRIADLNLQALGFSQGAQTYLMSLNNWDRGTAVELSKLTNEKGASRLEFHLNRYKGFLYEVQGKIPNRFLFPVYAWLNRGVIRLPEDLGRLTRALSVFTQQNNKFELKNIQQYPSLGDLEEAVSKVTGVNEESKRQVAKNIKMQGSREVYQYNEWRVIEMTTPEAVCELGKGTKWCTNADNEGLEYARMYLKGGPLFLFLHNEGGKWQKYAQITSDLGQVMDIYDRHISKPLPGFIQVLKSLAKNNLIDRDELYEYSNDVFYEGADLDLIEKFNKQLEYYKNKKFPESSFRSIINYISKFKVRYPSIENQIIFNKLPTDKNNIIDGDRIQQYIEDALHLKRGERWPDKSQEDIIAKSSYAFEYWKERYSYKYNFGENKPGDRDFSPWPEYEQELLKNPHRVEELVVYLWHLNGNKRASKEVENHILNAEKNNHSIMEFSILYAEKIIMGRWAELESIILEKEDFLNIIEYAERIIKGRWPEAEQVLLNNKWGLSDAIFYARDIIKGRWHELEERINKSTSDEIKKRYNNAIMSNKKSNKMNGWYKKANQKLTPQQIGLYHDFKTPSGVKLIGSGMSAVFQIPGINQTLNGAQLMSQVIGRIKNILIQNNVHTIDTSPVSRADAIGLAVSSEPGTVHVDIAKIFNTIKNQSLPSVTQLDGVQVDKDIQNDIIGKISNYITNQLANTAAHESKHNMDYFNSFPKGKFESSESGAEGFGNQIANQYFKL